MLGISYFISGMSGYSSGGVGGSGGFFISGIISGFGFFRFVRVRFRRFREETVSKGY